MSGSVHFVLSMDTEGPLYESTEACFERINFIFGLNLSPSEATLRKLQNREIDLGGQEDAIQRMIAPNVRDWLGNWRDVLDNVRFCMTPDYRRQLVDDRGRGLVFNWFICDWIGFENNPRQKPMGVNNVFSEYWSLFADHRADNPMYFHHHSKPFSGASHHPCRNWSNENSHITKISANLLEFGHFPACVRSAIMAPDINLFFEQYFPFDLSNGAGWSSDGQPDIASNRWVDWNGAPDDWSLYRPDIRDYRKPGALSRTIGRCLHIGGRSGNITRSELVRAFGKAEKGENVVVGCQAHDHSPMAKFSEYFDLMNMVRREFPTVKYYNSSAVEAFRSALGLEAGTPPNLSVWFDGTSLFVECDKDIFGSQPWFCFKTKDQRYLWDNLDWLQPRLWRYIFDKFTMPLESIERLAVGTADKAGNIGVCRSDVLGGRISASFNCARCT